MFKKIFAIVLFCSIFLFADFSFAAGLVNINTADLVELDTLPGIGAVKAQAIVDYRTQNGLFQKIEDIMNVSGIGQVTFDNMKSLITVGTVESTPTPTSTLAQVPAPQSAPVNNSEIVQTQKEILGYEIGSVVINELVSDPSDGEVEFVELYNKSMSAIDLTDWYVEEGSGKKSLLSYNIPANGFFVLEKPKGSLNNTGDIVKLFDPTGGLIDQVTYGDWNDGNKTNNAPKADDPYSLARRFDGEDSNNDIQDFVLTETITKNASNIIFIKGKEQKDSAQTALDIKTSTSTEIITKIIFDGSKNNNVTSTIKISEFLPNPVGADSAEFIELYNFGDTEMDLSGFKLDDEDGGSSPYNIPEKTIIKTGDYLVFANWETKISLNNTDDVVRLFDAKNRLVEEVPYDDVIEGASYARSDSDEWSWNMAVTPGKKNIIKNITPNKIQTAGKSKTFANATLENLHSASVGSKVKVVGYVAVLPNIFGTQYFYIVNENAGVQVYMNKKDFPDLTLGDEVEVAGEISEAYGETRVKVSAKEDIKKTGKNIELIPQQIEISDLDESLEGSFVQVKGEITELKTSYMFVDDGTGELKVYFKKGAKIQSKDFVLGDLVEVNGLLGNSSKGYQLLPRSMKDIQKVSNMENGMLGTSNEKIDKQKEITETYLTVTAGGLTSILIGLLAKARGGLLIVFTKKVGRVILAFVKRG